MNARQYRLMKPAPICPPEHRTAHPVPDIRAFDLWKTSRPPAARNMLTSPTAVLHRTMQHPSSIHRRARTHDVIVKLDVGLPDGARKTTDPTQAKDRTARSRALAQPPEDERHRPRAESCKRMPAGSELRPSAHQPVRNARQPPGCHATRPAEQVALMTDAPQPRTQAQQRARRKEHTGASSATSPNANMMANTKRPQEASLIHQGRPLSRAKRD